MRARLRFSVLCALGALGGGCSNARVEQVGRHASRLDLATAEVGPAFSTDAPSPMLAAVGHLPAVAFDGTGYAVVFEDAARVRAVRVAADGSVLDLEWLDFGGAGKGQTNPSVAFGSGKYLAVWSESEGVEPITIQARLFAPSGTIEGSQSFTVSTADEAGYTSVSFDGEDFLVAFNSDADVHVVRVAVTGRAIASSEIAVTSDGWAGRHVIAHGDSQTLVAWEERIDDLPAIRAARLDGSGTVLDPGGFRLSDSSAGEDTPAVAAIGDDFLVAWRHSDTPTSIRGSIVSADGTVSAKDIALSRSTLAAGLPSVAATADAYLVAWADERDRHSIYGTRVSSSGTLLDPADRKLAAGSPLSIGEPTNFTAPDPTALAAGEDQFLIAFIGEGVQGSLVDSDLTLDAGNIPISTVPSRQDSQQVSWTGQNYVISWIDQRSTKREDFDAQAVRIGADGERLDAHGIVLTSPGAFSLSQASRGDATWLAAWTTVSDQAIRLRHVAADGTPGIQQELSDPQTQSSPFLASNGDDFLSVNVAQLTLYGRQVAADGAPGTRFPILAALPKAPWLALAAHGDGYLLAVHDQTSLQLLTVGPDNAVGTPLLVDEGRWSPIAISSNGEQALLAISEGSDAGGAISARFYEDGALKGDVIALAEASAGYRPQVVWDGESFVVAWEADGTGTLEARTLSAEGALSPTRTLIDSDCFSPALASNGAGQLLVTCESRVTRRLVSYFIGEVPEVTDPPAGGRPNQGTGGRAVAGAAGETGSNGGVTANGGTNGSAGSDEETGGTDAANGGNNSTSGGRAASGGRAGGGMPNSPPAGSGGAAGDTAGTSAPVVRPAPIDGAGSDGCGCRLHTPSSRGKSPLVIALALAAALAFRRRRS